MVPGPVSNRSRLAPMRIKTEHELRCKAGTQVPEPRIVTFIPALSDVTAKTFKGFLGLKEKSYWLIETNYGRRFAMLK